MTDKNTGRPSGAADFREQLDSVNRYESVAQKRRRARGQEWQIKYSIPLKKPQLTSISRRKQLNDLPGDVLTKVTVLFYYSDPQDS
jgi:hypothetical protein